jgi:hemoglobin
MSLLSKAIPAIVVASGLALSACASSPAADASLYQRLGGKEAITAVVDDFVANVSADERINSQFAHTNIPRFKQKLVEQLCAGTGGPCTYTGLDMKAAHAGRNITEGQFNALVEDLVKSLDKLKVPAGEKNELLAILGPMKKDIVTR